MFEPFQVTCASCQGKVLVKNEKLVGRVVPCPRCQQALAIQPPQKIKIAPVAGAADSHAITKVAEPEWDQVIQDAIASQATSEPTSADSETKPSELRFKADDEFRLAPVEEESPQSVSSESLFNAIQLGLADRPGTKSGSTKKSNGPKPKQAVRQWLLVGVLGTAGSLVAFVCFYFFVQWNKSSKSRDPVAVVTPAELQKEDRTKPTDATSNKPPSPTTEPDLGKQEEPPVDTNRPETKQNESTTPDSDPMKSSKENIGEEATNSKPMVSEPPLGQADPSSKDDSQPKPNMEMVTPVKNPPLGQDDEIALPDIFKDFGSANRTNKQADTEPTLPKAIEDDPEVLEVEDVYHPPAGKAVDTEKSLGIKLNAIAWRDTPLIDVINGIALLSGMGISFDYESLIASGIQPLVPVTYDAKSTSLDVALTSILASFELAYRSDPNGLIRIYAGDELITKHLPSDWSLQDITGDAIAKWEPILRTAMQEESALWSVENNEVRWNAEATARQKFRLAIVLDRIRTALGLPIKGKYLSEDLASGWDDYQEAAKRLAKTAKSINPQTRPAFQILANAAREVDMRLMVDWPAVWEHGFTADVSQLTLLHNRRFDQVFRAYRDRFALEVTVLSGNMLWLTTPEIRRVGYQVRLVPLTANETLESLKEKLRPVSPTNLERRVTLSVQPLPEHAWALIRITAPTLQELSELVNSDQQPVE